MNEAEALRHQRQFGRLFRQNPDRPKRERERSIQLEPFVKRQRKARRR